MAEEKGKGKEEGAQAPKEPAAGGSKKKLLIISGILVADVLLLLGVAFFIAGRLKTPDPSETARQQQEDEELKKRQELTRIGHTLPKPWTFTVNIGGPGEEHYLKCSIQLEWDGIQATEGGGGGGGHGGGPALDPFGAEIEKRKDKISDIIINILAAQPYADLLRPAGKQKIKEAIVSEVSAILPPEHGRLKNAFFTEFLLQ